MKAARCEIDGIKYSYIPVDRQGRPAFFDDDGSCNHEFDWAWFSTGQKD